MLAAINLRVNIPQAGPALLITSRDPGLALFMSVIIVTSNAWGFAAGEWKDEGRKPQGMLLTGILFLVLGFCAIACSSRVG